MCNFKALILAYEKEFYCLTLFGWTEIKKVTFSHRNFYFYEKNGKQIIVAFSGIGLVNAAATTQILITHFEVKQIYNYGAVGASPNLKVYDIVVPQKIYFFDVETPWYAFGQTPQEAPFFYNSLNIEGSYTNSLASGNSFLDSTNKINYIKSKINVDIFDMEAAAISQICHQNNIPLFIVKSVSDIIGVDEPDLEIISTRINKAAKKALEKILPFLE